MTNSSNTKKLQSAFFKFHDAIKLTNKENKTLLKTKRDFLIAAIKNYFKQKSPKLPNFSFRNQGSYAMGTGIKNMPGEHYDIDIALEFAFSKDEYTPVEVKKWVADALTSMGTIIWKYPCIRAQYTKGYDVDFACFAKASKNNGKSYIAIGKIGNSSKNMIWEESDPSFLPKLFANKFPCSLDLLQCKRIIRYLKRWRDLKFNADDSRPSGIALTACALNWFSCKKNSHNKYRDIFALQELVKNMQTKFNSTHNLEVFLPLQRKNLFLKMNEEEQKLFLKHLNDLSVIIDSAIHQTSVRDACTELKKVFGDDFPTS